MNEVITKLMEEYWGEKQPFEVRGVEKGNDISLISDLEKYEIVCGDRITKVFLKRPKECFLREVSSELGFYSNELTFYRQVANLVQGINVPFCFGTLEDGSLLLESIEEGWHVSQFCGCSLEIALLIVDKLSIFHKEMTKKKSLANVFRGWSKEIVKSEREYFFEHCLIFQERYSLFSNCIDFEKLKSNYVMLWKGLDDCFCSLIHNDLRLDNIFLLGEKVYFIDWQMAKWGNVAYDLSFFIVGNLKVQDRRENCEKVVREYFRATFDEMSERDYGLFWRCFCMSIACHMIREINYLGENGYDEEIKEDYINTVFVRYLSAMEDYNIWGMMEM